MRQGGIREISFLKIGMTLPLKILLIPIQELPTGQNNKNIRIFTFFH